MATNFPLRRSFGVNQKEEKASRREFGTDSPTAAEAEDEEEEEEEEQEAISAVESSCDELEAAESRALEEVDPNSKLMHRHV